MRTTPTARHICCLDKNNGNPCLHASQTQSKHISLTKLQEHMQNNLICKHQRYINNEIILQVGATECYFWLDLALQYCIPDTFPASEAQELIAIAEQEDDINALVALECGKIVAQYGDQTEIRHLLSMTKSWTGLLAGVAEKQGLSVWGNLTWWRDLGRSRRCRG